jgi:hypothetical protein
MERLSELQQEMGGEYHDRNAHQQLGAPRLARVEVGIDHHSPPPANDRFLEGE